MPRRVLEFTDHPLTILCEGARTVVRLPGRPREYSALLDTGADRHFIDTRQAEAAGLRSCKTDNDVWGLNGQTGPKPVYESKLVLPDAGGLEIDGPLTGSELGDVQVILGRPLLARSRLVYDGRTGKVVLEIDDEFDMTVWVAEWTGKNAGDSSG